MTTNRGLGWRPDVPDIRDEKFAFYKTYRNDLVNEADIPKRLIVPWQISRRSKRLIDNLPVDDQLNSSSCTGQSVGTLIDQQSGWTKRSKLQLYWYGRETINETHLDNGAYIRDVIKGASKIGAGSERLWPFNVQKVTEQPSRLVMFSANRHKVHSYHRLQTRQDFLSCLFNRFAFVIGFMVYDQFVTANSSVDRFGILNLPKDGERSHGGHAVTVIGYDNDFRNSPWGAKALANGLDVPTNVYIVRNSWGSHWGHNGNFAVDCRYFENSNLADDAWTVRVRKNFT